MFPKSDQQQKYAVRNPSQELLQLPPVPAPPALPAAKLHQPLLPNSTSEKKWYRAHIEDPPTSNGAFKDSATDRIEDHVRRFFDCSLIWMNPRSRKTLYKCFWCRTERGHSWRLAAIRSYQLQMTWVLLWRLARSRNLKISIQYENCKP